MAIENVKCPECDGSMTSRKNSSTGQRFWGCNAFPKCRGTRNTDGEAPRRSFDRDDDGAVDRSPSDRQRDNDRQRWRHQ
jgi:ssDNA-binding Zn-finger/Zn-ribbon topoisomerase 1